jgi:hypothetical protein
MRFFPRSFLIVMVVACLTTRVGAAIQVTLVGEAGTQPWQLLAVEFPPASGEVEIAVQDARGGPEFVRRVPGNGGKTWLPMPLESPAQLGGPGGGKWALGVSLRANGRTVEQAHVDIPLNAVENPPPRVVSSVSKSPGNVPGVQLPMAEILTAPALLFAACDIVCFTPDMQSEMSETRALEILSVGARLAVADATAAGPPPSGNFSRLLWRRTELPGIGPCWVTAGPPLARPALVESGLAAIREDAFAKPSANVSRALILVTPAAMALLLIAAGLFRSRRAVLLGSFLFMTVLSAVIILYLRGNSVRQSALAEWRQAGGGGEVQMEERLTAVEATFSAGFERAAEDMETLLPVAGTREEYWSLRSWQVHLDGRMRLTGRLAPRRAICLETRKLRLGGILPAFPQTAADRARLWRTLNLDGREVGWLIGGYVKSGEAPDESGVVLSAWLTANPGFEGSAKRNGAGSPTMAWYHLRFQAAHRYLLFRRDGFLTVLDFGPPERGLQESQPHP